MLRIYTIKKSVLQTLTDRRPTPWFYFHIFMNDICPFIFIKDTLPNYIALMLNYVCFSAATFNDFIFRLCIQTSKIIGFSLLDWEYILRITRKITWEASIQHASARLTVHGFPKMVNARVYLNNKNLKWMHKSLIMYPTL